MKKVLFVGILTLTLTLTLTVGGGLPVSPLDLPYEI